ncbi:hypothetical protein LCGC14_0807700 [marine sediment metagenome]|uniref:DPCK n=1 Tax=marine sediment metagenome TaxID=412755 RepID=A0A0F9Q7Q2_9ZZZZ
MDYNLRIPYDKRHLFAEPLDILISGTREETLVQVENIFKDYVKLNHNVNFYIVGDIVAMDFFSNQFLKSFIKICIIDEKTQRNHISIDFEEFFEQTIEFQNPEGIIQKDCWNLFKKIIKTEKTTLVLITEGEEDLLILPLVLEIPVKKGIKNFAFYGQPPITDSKYVIPEGIVIVDVDKMVQEKVKNVISIMEKF